MKRLTQKEMINKQIAQSLDGYVEAYADRAHKSKTEAEHVVYMETMDVLEQMMGGKLGFWQKLRMLWRVL